MTTTYAGLPACSCQDNWCPHFERHLLERYGIRIQWAQLIGGSSKSGGTHVGGGACDCYVVDPGPRSVAEAYRIVIRVARQMGAKASWFRQDNWDRRGGEKHAHICLHGCPHGTPHYGYQEDAVDDGYNGLGTGGRGGPDDGPRPIPDRTWRQGIEWAQAQEDDDMFTDKDRDRLEYLYKLHAPATKTRPEGPMVRWSREVTENSREAIGILRVVKRTLSPGGDTRTLVEGLAKGMRDLVAPKKAED